MQSVSRREENERRLHCRDKRVSAYRVDLIPIEGEVCLLKWKRIRTLVYEPMNLASSTLLNLRIYCFWKEQKIKVRFNSTATT